MNVNNINLYLNLLYIAKMNLNLHKNQNYSIRRNLAQNLGF